MKPAYILMLLALATAQGNADEAFPEAAPPGTHTVSSDRLRAIMDNINQNIVDDTDSGAVPGAIDPGQLAQLVEAIEELLYHAELMSEDVAPRHLSATEVVTFRALASQLYTEALNVRTLAEENPVNTYDFNLLNAAYERLYQTCTACHDQFRDR